MAITCNGCRYLSAFGTMCLMGRERRTCRDKAMREEPDTVADMILSKRIDAVAKDGAAGSNAVPTGPS